MPIPKPTTTETEPEFMRRCMGDEVMVEDYADNGQRFAVCQSAWESVQQETMGSQAQATTYGASFVRDV